MINGRLRFKRPFQLKQDAQQEQMQRRLAEENQANEMEFYRKIKRIEDPKMQESFSLKEQDGTGRVLSSGRSVHGMGTKFMTELVIGDQLVIVHPTSLVEECRLIQLVLSHRSIQIDTPFSTDLVSYTAFRFRRKIIQQFTAPNLEEQFANKIMREEEEEEKRAKMQLEVLDQAKLKDPLEVVKLLNKKIKKQATTLHTREKKGMWGYKTVSTSYNKQLSNQEQLDIRIKKSRDKFCWN